MTDTQSSPIPPIRTDDHETSEEAAEKIASMLPDLQSKVYRELYRCRGLTDSELTERCNNAYGVKSESTYRKRRSELTILGFVRRTDQKRANGRGNMENVYEIVPNREATKGGRVELVWTRLDLERLLGTIHEMAGEACNSCRRSDDFAFVMRRIQSLTDDFRKADDGA